MRKAILLAAPLMVPLIVGVAILLFEAGRPPDWRVELGQYILYQNTHSPETVSIQAVAKASQPWKFSPAMSTSVFGDSVFRTDNRYNGRKGGYITLPFPPEQIYCVLLEYGDRHELAFVSRHNDQVWWQDWVVHQGSSAPFSFEFRQTVSLLGCDLDLEE